MGNTEQKAKAESFVRQTSFKDAADLPSNKLAQFLAQNQSQEIALKEKERVGMVKDFTHWISAENFDMFVAAGPTWSHSPINTDVVVTALKIRRWRCCSRGAKSCQRLG